MMIVAEPNEIVWRTSNYSGSDENGTAAEQVLVRDTKDRAAPALTFSTPATLP